jgi:hypothetical protein
MPLGPGVRLQLAQLLDGLCGRVMYMDLTSGQRIDHIQRARMVPDTGPTREAARLSGTRLFCADQHLPMRSLKDAEPAIPCKYSPRPSAALPAS